MSRQQDEESLSISRRELLKRAGIVGAAAAAVPVAAFAQTQVVLPRREPLETLPPGGEALEPSCRASFRA